MKEIQTSAQDSSVDDKQDTTAAAAEYMRKLQNIFERQNTQFHFEDYVIQ
jgi:hypothetical protein